MSGMAQASATDQPIEEASFSQTSEMTEAYERYQAALREVFTNIRDGVLQVASESLLEISKWLLSKVVELGKLLPNGFKTFVTFNY